MASRRVRYAAQTMFWPPYYLQGGTYGGWGDGYAGLDPISGILEGAGSITGMVAGSIQQSQQTKRDDACGTAAMYKNKYMACKKANQAKGKPVYPGNPGKGPFYTDCREDYKKWQKYKGLCEEGSGSSADFDAAAMEAPVEGDGSSLMPVLLGGAVLIGVAGLAYVAMQPAHKVA